MRLLLDLVRLKGRFQREKRATIEDLDALESKLQKYVERLSLNDNTIPHILSIATAVRNYQFFKSKAGLQRAEIRKRTLLLQHYFQSRVNDQFHSHCCYFYDAEQRIDPL